MEGVNERVIVSLGGFFVVLLREKNNILLPKDVNEYVAAELEGNIPVDEVSWVAACTCAAMRRCLKRKEILADTLCSLRDAYAVWHNKTPNDASRGNELAEHLTGAFFSVSQIMTVGLGMCRVVRMGKKGTPLQEAMVFARDYCGISGSGLSVDSQLELIDYYVCHERDQPWPLW